LLALRSGRPRREGAVARVLDAIRGGDDVYLVETTLCDRDLTPLWPQRNLDTREEQTFELGDRDDRLRYFRLAANTQAFFSFCGAVVFRRDRWMSADAAAVEPFIGSCWAHAARLLSLLPRGLRVHPIPGPLTRKRMENDSFSSRGAASRVRIGIDGYLRIADAFFGRDSEGGADQTLPPRRYTLTFMTGTMIDVVDQRLTDDARTRRAVRQIYDSAHVASRIPAYARRLANPRRPAETREVPSTQRVAARIRRPLTRENIPPP
jgi:hypothetical protein